MSSRAQPPLYVLGWRDIVLDGKAERARDSKGTWQMVFALYGENTTATYYWLWRQWEMRGRRRRRALGDEVHRVVEAMTGNPGFAGRAMAEGGKGGGRRVLLCLFFIYKQKCWLLRAHSQSVSVSY